MSKSLLREAVEQAVAAGRDEIGLAAAAGHVGRVPGLQIGRGLGVRSIWPSIVLPKVLLDQLLQVRLRFVGNTGRPPSSRSWRHAGSAAYRRR